MHHGVHAASVLVPRPSWQLGFLGYVPGRLAVSKACKIVVRRSSNILLTKLNQIP